VDSLLVKAGSGLATFGIPDSKGVPEDLARHTYVAEFNHLESVEAITKIKEDIACVILEPIMGNMGVILPEASFLEGVRELCSSKGILLIFDEVITGFRVAFGGAQALYGIRPDMTCLGKIIGGDSPSALSAAERNYGKSRTPRNIYQAARYRVIHRATAGAYVLRYLKEHPDFYEMLRRQGETLKAGMLACARKNGISFTVNGTTGMFTGFFTDNEVGDYEEANRANRKAYEMYFQGMLEEGIFFAPSQFEAAFLTLFHGDNETAKTLDACERVFKAFRV
jgi:glutamate-1-semialdehyde 2,1-aminomutase